MKKEWDDIVITTVKLAMYVTPGSGTAVHKDRPFHGLVINDTGSTKDYLFTDGTVMKTESGSVFYLPKGSSYRVKTEHPGCCYAINFDTLQDIQQEPFVVNFRNNETVLKCFRQACSTFTSGGDIRNLLIRKDLYEIICHIRKELQRQYMPSRKEQLIQPALDAISANATLGELSVSDLAQLCGISEVYFRRIFFEKFGTSPKEYLISRRIEYAKTLLSSRQFQISEVAEMCGYSEPCHFSREFSKHAGVSPKAYAKTAKAE